ncbi:hypothetical protein LCGC14_2415120, partial [marine sediment metagenome]
MGSSGGQSISTTCKPVTNADYDAKSKAKIMPSVVGA